MSNLLLGNFLPALIHYDENNAHEMRRRGCRAGKHLHVRHRQGHLFTLECSHTTQPGCIPVVNSNRPEVNLALGHRRLTDRHRVLSAVRRAQHQPAAAAGAEYVVPTLYVLNAAAITKPHAIQHLAAGLTAYEVDIAVITETHLKKKHADHSFAIDGYSLFRRDRQGRRGGGVAVHVKNVMSSDVWTCHADLAEYELLWILVKLNSHTFLTGAVYHPPKPMYQPSSMLDYIEASIDAVTGAYPSATVILAGDFNALDDSEIISRNALLSIIIVQLVVNISWTG